MSWLSRFEGVNDPPPMQYHSGPDTLLWTRLGQTCWQREDGVKVVQHQSADGKWAIADPYIHAHSGWFPSKFGAMNAADILIPDRYPSHAPSSKAVSAGVQVLTREMSALMRGDVNQGQLVERVYRAMVAEDPDAGLPPRPEPPPSRYGPDVV